MIGEVVDMNGSWRDLYQVAVLELQPEELRPRIDEAERAIQQRITELRRDDTASADEYQALDDALRMLRLLVSTECKAHGPTVSGSIRDEVTS